MGADVEPVEIEAKGTFDANSIFILVAPVKSVRFFALIVGVEEESWVALGAVFKFSVKVCAAWWDLYASFFPVEIEAKRTFYTFSIFEFVTSRISGASFNSNTFPVGVEFVAWVASPTDSPQGIEITTGRRNLSAPSEFIEVVSERTLGANAILEGTASWVDALRCTFHADVVIIK